MMATNAKQKISKSKQSMTANEAAVAKMQRKRKAAAAGLPDGSGKVPKITRDEAIKQGMAKRKRYQADYDKTKKARGW